MIPRISICNTVMLKPCGTLKIHLPPWHVAIAFMEATSTDSDVLGSVCTGQSSHHLKEMNALGNEP